MPISSSSRPQHPRALQAIIVFIQNYRTQSVDIGYVLAAMMCVASFFVALGKAHSYQRVRTAP